MKAKSIQIKPLTNYENSNMQQEKEQVFLSSSTTAINSMITFDSAQKADEQAKLTKLAYRSTINFLELVKARIS